MLPLYRFCDRLRSSHERPLLASTEASITEWTMVKRFAALYGSFSPTMLGKRTSVSRKLSSERHVRNASVQFGF